MNRFAARQSLSEVDFERRRQAMVQRQLEPRGITDRRVLDAMSRVPRERFVDLGSLESAYDDRALPIACQQTISQPFTVAFMVQALQLTGDEKVLEIGTGSGYAAAVLSLVASQVDTVERIPKLAERASDRLQALGYTNCRVHIADGTLGWAQNAPYDAIVVAAAGESLPAALADQLTPRGRIVIPLGPQQASQRMWRFTRIDDHLLADDLGAFCFVPLIADAPPTGTQ